MPEFDGLFLQQVLDCTLPEQRLAIVKELDPQILDCIKDSNGNHVCILTHFFFSSSISIVHLFYQMFLHQMPVMHISTFTVDGKPQILLSAMQACGALYVKTAAAGHFINETLRSAREQLMSEFVSIMICVRHIY